MPFAPRCPYADDLCREEMPDLELQNNGQKVRCWHAEKIAMEGGGTVCVSKTYEEKAPILEVKGLQKFFPVKGPLGKIGGVKAHVKAVNDVSFQLYEGETYGLVGESGCGKSTTGRTILRLTEPTGGSAIYKNKDIFQLTGKDQRDMRKELQMVFQDPYSSLNPRKRIGKILEEPLVIHSIGTKKERTEIVMDILDKVGMRVDHYYRYPHELSGDNGSGLVWRAPW